MQAELFDARVLELLRWPALRMGLATLLATAGNRWPLLGNAWQPGGSLSLWGAVGWYLSMPHVIAGQSLSR